MITAGVQQALQTLEIAGASASALPDAPVLGEEFRLAFTSKVSDDRGDANGRALATAKANAPAVVQSRCLVEESEASRSWSLLQAHTSFQTGIETGVQSRTESFETSATAAGAGAQRENTLTKVLGRSNSGPDASGADATESAVVGLEEGIDSESEAASVPVLANGGADEIAVVARTIKGTAPLSGTSSDLEPRSASETRDLPVTVKAAGSGRASERAVQRDRKRELTSATEDVAGAVSQIAASSHDLVAHAASMAGPVSGLPTITILTRASERSWPAKKAGALPASAPARTASGGVTPVTERAENKGVSTIDSGDARPVMNSNVSGLAGANRAVLARATRGVGANGDQASAGSRGVTAESLSASGPESPGLATEKPARSGDQIGETRGLPEGAGERSEMSSVVQDAGPSSGVATGIQRTTTSSPHLSSTLSSSVPLKSISTEGIGEANANSSVSASKIAAARVFQTGLRTEVKAGFELSGAALGAGILEKRTASPEGSRGSPVDVTRQATETFSRASDRTAASLQDSGLAPAAAPPELPLPVELPGGAIAASQSGVVASRDRTVKGPADKGDKEQNDAAIAASQPGSTKDSSGSASDFVVARSGDLAANAVPAGVNGVAGGSTHAASAALGSAVLPGHAAGPSAPALAVTSAGRADAKPGAATNAQAPVASQSGDSHRTLLATPTTLEVGLQSGTQGWLKIRAEAAGQGDVKASLDAVTASGRELLHSQLPALNAFLRGEQMPVTATVAQRDASPEAAASGPASGSSEFSGASHGALLQQGGDRQTSEQPTNFSPNEPATHGTSEAVTSYDARGSVSDSIESLSARQVGAPGENGRWLNVRV